MLPIIEKFGYKPGLMTLEGKVTQWPYDVPQPSDEEIEAIILEWEEKQAALDARIQAYPPIADQLDLIYHDFNGWKLMIKAIKEANPLIK